jgi:lactam utilization protein B
MDDRKFEVRCDATPDGQLQVKSRSLSVAVSQSIQLNKSEEMWQSVLVLCERGEDGALTTKVIVCHPDWDQNLQIACVRSCMPDRDNSALRTLEIDLKARHV